MMTRKSMDDEANEIVERFAHECQISKPKYKIVDKAGEKFLAIEVGHINNVFAIALEVASGGLEEDSNFYGRTFLREVKLPSVLESPEVELLERLISESLTVGRSSLESDYHRKMIPFLGGEERQIFGTANHVVFGRRGAGKSSLVLYACNQAKKEAIPYVWIAFQQYNGRDDLSVIPQVLYEFVEGIERYSEGFEARIKRLRKIVSELEDLDLKITKQAINFAIPKITREVVPIVNHFGKLFLCFDDLHLLSPSLQPYFLSVFYSFSRGNNISLKITAIENFCKLYDDTLREGLEPPGDAQIIRLDYNLVDPKAAYDHISNVLSGYVSYVGLKSTASLVVPNVMQRLAWTSAGVPRDALYIFQRALTKARAAGRKKVTVTDVNMSAAESLTEKERYASDDATSDENLIRDVISDIKRFCLQEKKCNAFLVFIDVEDPIYNAIQKVSDLRFLHVLHPGITPEKAGQRYEALLLDYAFYTGFRKAQSIKEFKTELEPTLAKELRELDTYRYKDRTIGPS
ncbi:MAG: hypothetical protein AAGA58_18565 [Verrucomicrobiota bacterium]